MNCWCMPTVTRHPTVLWYSPCPTSFRAGSTCYGDSLDLRPIFTLQTTAAYRLAFVRLLNRRPFEFRQYPNHLPHMPNKREAVMRCQLGFSSKSTASQAGIESYS